MYLCFPREKFSRIVLFAIVDAEGVECHLVQDCGGSENRILRNAQGVSDTYNASGYLNRFGCAGWYQSVADTPRKHSEER